MFRPTSDLLHPTQLKSLCSQYRLSPSKHYGQHFLISDLPIKKMIEAGELAADDTVVEIGPGFGVLTLSLVPFVKKVIAFEIERKLQPYWEAKQAEYSNLEVVWGNALNQLSATSYKLSARYKVVANLPYQITSQMIRMFLETEPKPERMVLMVQKEVAERICAKPGEMSLLSVAVQYYGAPRIVAKVPKGNFWPMPKVDSAVIIIKTQEHENMLPDEVFFRVVRAGFAHKRKQLWRNLAEGLHVPAVLVKSILTATNGKERARAEELSIAEWRALANAIYPHLKNDQAAL